MRKSAMLAAVVAVSTGLLVTRVSMADAQAAKDYVKEAQALVESKDFDSALGKLELAEAELDGVDAGTKAPISASIEAVKKSIAAAKAGADVPKYKRKLERVMDDAEGAIGNQVIWGGAARAAKELFDDPAAQAAIPDELTAAKKKFATFEKLSSKKIAAAVGGQIEEELKQLEAKWAELKPVFSDPDGDKRSASREISRDMDSAKRVIGQLGADSEEAKPYLARVDKIGAEFTELALADQAKEVLRRLSDYFDGYKEEYEGWEQETGEGPTWAAYGKEQNEKMSAFFAPKTKGFISRSGSFLKNLEDNSEYKEVSSASGLKAFVEKMKADRARATASMMKHLKPLVTTALASGGRDLSKLKDDVRLALGEDSEEGNALQEAIQKKLDSAAAAGAAGEEAAAAWYKKMSEAAAAAWPGIEEKFSAEEGFDANDAGAFKGKTIKLTTDNLMGWRFKPGDFEFATTKGGFPIAAHFDPALKAAIDKIEAKLGRSLGDNDDDGKWEIYAVVTGKKGRMMQKKEGEGDLKVDGQDVGKVTVQYSDPVDAPVINIVAAKCGPFAGGKGVGIVKEDGTFGK